MSKFILNAKHWQLFTLTVGLAFIGMILYVIGILNSIRFVTTYVPSGDGELSNVTESVPFVFSTVSILLFVLAGLLFIVATFVQMSWLWHVGTKMGKYFSAQTRQFKVNRFKVFYFTPMIYILLLGLLIPLLVSTGLKNYGELNNPILFGLIILVLIFCHLFAIFCGIYIMYFVAKSYKTVMIGKEAHFSDYIGEFFAIWFFPVGIWIIQPNINKIVNGDLDNFDNNNTLNSINDF